VADRRRRHAAVVGDRLLASSLLDVLFVEPRRSRRRSATGWAATKSLTVPRTNGQRVTTATSRSGTHPRYVRAYTARTIAPTTSASDRSPSTASAAGRRSSGVHHWTPDTVRSPVGVRIRVQSTTGHGSIRACGTSNDGERCVETSISVPSVGSVMTSTRNASVAG